MKMPTPWSPLLLACALLLAPLTALAGTADLAPPETLALFTGKDSSTTALHHQGSL